MQFALRVLGLSTLSLDNGMISPFQICGVVVPKLVSNRKSRLYFGFNVLLHELMYFLCCSHCLSIICMGHLTLYKHIFNHLGIVTIALHIYYR